MLDTVYKIVMIPLMFVWLIELLWAMIEKIKDNKKKREKKVMICSGFDCKHGEDGVPYPWCQIRDEYCDIPFLGECCHVDKDNFCEMCKNNIKCRKGDEK